MTRRFACNFHVIRFVAPFAAIVTILLALASVAQQTGADPSSERPAAASASHPADVPPSSPRRRNASPAALVPNDTLPLFVPAVDYSSGVLGSSITMADVNGDGKLDLLVTNEDSVGVLLGNGDGTFQPIRCWGVGGAVQCDANNQGAMLPHQIAVGDLNGDGKLDLVVAYQQSFLALSPVGVLLGNGDGTFQGVTIYAANGWEANGVAVADFNGDGRLDVVVTNYCPAANDCPDEGLVSVLLGNGDGTLQAAQPYGSGGYLPNSVAVADVNGDGKPDLVVGDEIGGVAVLLGNGDGTFQAAQTYGSGASGETGLALGDVNGDGKLDIVASNECIDDSCGQGAVGVLLGNGNGTFQTAQVYGSAGYGALGVALGDVNGDGNLDVLVANDCFINCYLDFQATGAGAIAALLGRGDGTFQAAETYDSGGWGANGVAVGDLNGDSKLSLVASNNCGDMCVGYGVVGVLLSNDGRPTTTTILSSSADPAQLSQTVTYTASVQSPSGEPITGSVTFDEDYLPSATVSLVASQATYSTSYPNTGLHAITVVYSGDVNNAVSSDTLVESVATKPTETTTKLASSGDPSLVGQPVTFTAAITWGYGTVPNGELVTFYYDGVAIGTRMTASGVATVTTSLPSAGTHTVKATYAGDQTLKPSSAKLAQVVDKNTTTTAIVSSPNPSFLGQAVDLSATVTSAAPGGPTGKVTFTNGDVSLGSATLNAGTATLSTKKLPLGVLTITAAYEGDTQSAKSSGSTTQTVVSKYATTTTLVSSLNPSAYGQSVTWTATVTSTGPNTPTGSVKFVGLGYAPLSGGVATFTNAWLNAGTVAITAEYEGDAASAASASSVLSQVVNAASTTTVITSSADPSTLGQNVTFTATVTSSTGAHATGTVTFTATGMLLGTVPLEGTVATFSTAALPVASFAITAIYNGATDFTGSQDTLIQSIEP